MNNSQVKLQRGINSSIQPRIPTRAWDSTVAVVVGDADHAWHIASGTLFRLADFHFIVTAAHAIRSAVDSKLTALAITGGDDHRLISVPAPWMCSTPKEGEEADRFDVAVHRLSDEALSRLTGRKFLRLSDVEFGDAGPEAVYTIFGYPGLWSVPITDRSEAL